VFSEGGIPPSGWKPLDYAAVRARVELVPFPSVQKSGVFPQPARVHAASIKRIDWSNLIL